MASTPSAAEQQFRIGLAGIQSHARSLKRRILETLSKKQADRLSAAMRRAAAK